MILLVLLVYVAIIWFCIFIYGKIEEIIKKLIYGDKDVSKNTINESKNINSNLNNKTNIQSKNNSCKFNLPKSR